MSRQSRPLELLAPAGDMTCLHAAVSAGADAVYLGLDGFNARRNAGNFAVEGSFAEACDYAHLRGVGVYVTLNVEILPSEMDCALRLAHAAYRAGADAFIVQDIGLAARLKQELPQAQLHISTQMNVHNAAGVAAAAQLGARRVTFARELSVAEIAELSDLAANFDMETECFAHGALCVCYSGQCLMSSMIGGRSANRGLCAQACRLPYQLYRADCEDALPAEGEHLLSPRDLCTVDILPDLAAAGVASLKIEGRMKSPDYVHAVVSVYREVLDSGRPATEAQRARLAEAFSRGFTTAYLEGQRGNDIMSYGRPNNRGVFAGRVARTAEGEAFIAPEIALHAGDVLEFWTNRGHFAATVENAVPANDGTVRIAIDQRTGKGDRVFRVRNAELSFEDDPFAPRVPVAGTVTLRIGQPARISFERVPAPEPPAGAGSHSEASAPACIGEASGDIVECARTKSITAEDVRAHVDRLGNTPFTLETLEVDLDENVGIGFSQLHRLRATALSNLHSKLLASYGSECGAGVGGPVGELPKAATDEGETASPALSEPRSGESAGLPNRNDERLASESSFTDSTTAPRVVALTTNPQCARAARKAGADAVYVPLLNFRRGQSQLAGVWRREAEQAGYPKQCVMALPAVDHDPVAPFASSASGRTYPGTREYDQPFDMWDYVREGRLVFADSLAGAVRALDLGAQVEVGPHVPATNRATLDYLAQLGVSRVWLSPELTLGQIADLAQESPLPLGLVVAGAQELMITEHCLLMSQGPCAQACESCERRGVSHRLVDRKGFDFPVVTDMMGRSHLYNGIDLDAVAALPDLLDIGISAVMVDTTLMQKKDAAESVARAVRARDLAQSERRALPKRANTTTGHLFRGVS